MSGTPAQILPNGTPVRVWHPAGWLVVVAAFLVGFVNYPMQVVGWRFDQLPGDEQDNRLNNFILEHGYRWLTGQAGADFWDAPSYFPKQQITACSDAHIGMLPLYVAARAVGATPEQAFQWHFLISFVLNFAAAAWAARRLGFGPIGTAAAAYTFTFSLSVVAQSYHAQLIPRFLVPPAIVFAWEFLLYPRMWRLTAAAWSAVGQLYLSIYIGYFLALTLATGFTFVLLRFGRGLEWRKVIWPVEKGRVGGMRALLLAGLTAYAGIMAYVLLEQHNQGVYHINPVLMIKESAPIPVSWLTPPKNSYHHPAVQWSILRQYKLPEGEHVMCPGLFPIAAVLLVAPLIFLPTGIGTTRQVALAAAWVTLLLAALVTRFGDLWLYESIAKLPGVNSIRVPGRVCLVPTFTSGLAVGFLLDAAVAWARRFGVLPMVLVAGAGLGVVAIDQRLLPREGHEEYRDAWQQYHFPLSESLARQERIAEIIRRQPAPKTVYVFPTAGSNNDKLLETQVEAMRASQDLGIPCVNGWTGHVPLGWDYFRGYRHLMDWLQGMNGLSEKQLDGLVLIGDPEPDPDPEYDKRMRATFPPQR